MAGWPHDEEQDALTPAERELHRHLLADGVAWRQRAEPTLPGLGAFISRAQQRLDDERAATASLAASIDAPTALDNHHTSTRIETTERPRASLPANRLAETQHADSPKGSYRMSSIPPVTVTPHPPRRRFAGIAAGAAALIVVALIAVVLTHAFGARPNTAGNKGHNTAQATPRPTIIPTPTGGSGTSQAFLQPAIAPSNPQIVYLVDGDNSIQRSANGGHTYTQLAAPPTTLQNPQFSIIVSPLDANYIIVDAVGSATFGAGTPVTLGCPAANTGQATAHIPLVALSGNVPCAQSFYSVNGGQTWRAVQMPYTGVIASSASLHLLASTLNITTTTIVAQGSRLYATVGDSENNGIIIGAPGAHLVASDDGGLSWHVADNGLGSYFCDFAPAPTGGVIYAITSSGGCDNESQPPLTLWRSDDAGASWAQVGTLPTPNEGGMFVAADGSLYVNMPQSGVSQPHQSSVVYGPDALIVSRDGGQTFTRAPLSGAPAQVEFAGPAGALSDGSVLMASFSTNDLQQTITTFYAWRAGQSSWRQIGKAVSGEVATVVVMAQGAKNTLYLGNGLGEISRFTV